MTIEELKLENEKLKLQLENNELYRKLEEWKKNYAEELTKEYIRQKECAQITERDSLEAFYYYGG